MILALVARGAAITVAVETGVFAIAGFRQRTTLAVCALANLVSNLSLHLVMILTQPTDWWTVTAFLEVGAFLFEWLWLALVVPRPLQRRLPWVLVCSNALSFSIGWVVNAL
jgi:hypothetical protein